MNGRKSTRMGDLAKSRKIRGGHRGHLKKLLGQAKAVLENFKEEDRIEASQLREGITDASTNIKKLETTLFR